MEKTYRATVLQLTKRKQQRLNHDYNNYQWWMIFGMDHGLLSAFKSAKGYKQEVIKYKDYPLPLESRFIKNWFRTRETKLAKHWIKIPNSQRKGIGIWLPLRFHQKLPKTYTIKDSWLVKKKNKYYLHLCIDVPEPQPYAPTTILGIDLGLKNPITMVDIKSGATHFLGKELKRTKGKYFYLRRSLGRKKKLKIIKKLKHKEKNKIKTILHKVTKRLVDHAYNEGACLVLGGLRFLPKNKGRKMNRKLSSFSAAQFTTYLAYKAKQKGVPFLIVNEAYTSKTCHVCGMRGTRKRNWFQCDCGYEDNADRNAAFNIGRRGFSYMLESGAHAYAQKFLIQKEQAQSLVMTHLVRA